MKRHSNHTRPWQCAEITRAYGADKTDEVAVHSGTGVHQAHPKTIKVIRVEEQCPTESKFGKDAPTWDDISRPWCVDWVKLKKLEVEGGMGTGVTSDVPAVG